MKALSFVALGVFSIAFATSCSSDDFPKYVELGGLRILALQTGTNGGAAENAPGDSVTVTPYVSDYRGARTITYAAVACTDPGIGAGVEPTCDGVADRVAVANGALTIPATSRTGAGNSFTVNIPSTALAGRSAADQYNGVGYLLTYTLTASDGTTVRSFKRLIVSSKSPKNMNPTLTGVLANGSPMTAMPAGEVTIRASYLTGSIESYSAMKTDQSVTARTEELVTTYFITDGSLKTFRTVNDQTTTYTPPSPVPTDHTPVMVAVTRDSRGGISVVVQGL